MRCPPALMTLQQLSPVTHKYIPNNPPIDSSSSKSVVVRWKISRTTNLYVHGVCNKRIDSTNWPRCDVLSNDHSVIILNIQQTEQLSSRRSITYTTTQQVPGQVHDVWDFPRWLEACQGHLGKSRNVLYQQVPFRSDATCDQQALESWLPRHPAHSWPCDCHRP